MSQAPEPLRFASAQEASNWMIENGLAGFPSPGRTGYIACYLVYGSIQETDTQVWAYSSPEEMVYLEAW